MEGITSLIIQKVVDRIKYNNVGENILETGQCVPTLCYIKTIELNSERIVKQH